MSPSDESLHSLLHKLHPLSSGPWPCRVDHVGTLGGELWKFSTPPDLIQQSDNQNHPPFTALRPNRNVWLVYLDELRFRFCDA